MKKQILVIHGGGSFESYDKYITFLKNSPLEIRKLIPRNDWKDNLQSDLGDEFEVLLPTMPNKTNAQYPEWKIVFEKVLGIIDKEIILIGHSLGTLFLAKYLSENTIDKNVSSLHLVSGPFDNTGLDDEDLGTFSLTNNLSSINNIVENIYIYHSNDDKVVPVAHAHKYHEALSDSNLEIFDGRGHIKMEHFPELVLNVNKEIQINGN